jgi:hypothetical protein
MKTSLFVYLCLMSMLACKKEGGSGKQLYLSKVFVNDLLSEEYIYSSDMHAIRRNSYSTGGGQSTFFSFRIYEYENGLLSKMLRYSKEGNLSEKRELSYDASNKIKRIDNFGNDEVLDGYGVFEYDNNQQLSKIIFNSGPPTKKTGEWQVKYDAQNNLLSLKRYYLSLGNLILFDSVQFTHADKAIPAHWQLYEELLQEFPAEKTIEFITADSMYYYLAGGPPVRITTTISGKTYNGQGYLISQQYKQESDNGLGTTTFNYNLKYEYIE